MDTQMISIAPAPIKRNYGWKRQLPDHRDPQYKVAMACERATAYPPRTDLRLSFPPVFNQQDLGSCTSNSWMGLVGYNRIVKKLPLWPNSGSRLFHYYNERVQDGDVEEDDGSTLRTGAQVLQKLGICDENLWPYIESQFTTKPTQEVYAAAAGWKAEVCAQLNGLGDMLTCLAAGHPFVFGFSVYDGFESQEVAETGILNLPTPSEQMLGGHAVCACGYSIPDQHFIVRNSWGPGWGQQGYFMMPFAYITNPNLASDFWTARIP